MFSQTVHKTAKVCYDYVHMKQVGGHQKEKPMKKIMVLVLLVAGLGFVFAGGQGEEGADAMSRPTEVVIEDSADVQPALGPDGAWIVIFEGDVAVDSQVVVDGEVYAEEGADAPRRKIALYTQDGDRNVTARFTLTVPELVVRHENTRIQAGTIAGDVYVEAEGFELTSGASIEGNLYFASEALQDSANIGDDTTVTGEIGIGSL